MTNPEAVERALRNEDYPASFRASERVANTSQRRAMRWTAVQLWSLVAAAVFSALPSILDLGSGVSQIIGGLFALVAFTLAFGISLLLTGDKTFDNWHAARTIAESVKALTWTYVVCGEPFVRKLPEEDADRLFQQRLGELMKDTENVSFGGGGEGAQISPRMRELRAFDLARRKASYTNERVLEQQAWYDARAERDGQRARQWFLLGLLANLAGIVGAALRSFEVVEADLLGIFAVLATAITAWIQAKQYRVLANSYAGVSQELATLAIGLPYVDTEEEWATFVRDAEGTIAQEHALWRARRGVVL